MHTLVEQINALCATFAVESEKNLQGNKQAGLRARKASLELEKLLKVYRKESVAASK
jgi:hypothetical protein